MLSAVVVLVCLPETLTKKKLVSVAYIVNHIKCKFRFTCSTNSRSVDSSLIEKEELNGEAVPSGEEGQCPPQEFIGEDQSSCLCSSDSSVEPSGLCHLLIIQACLQGIHSLSSHCAALSNICLIKKC